MKNQKGFIVPLLLVIIAFLLVGGGAYVFTQKNQAVPVASGNVELPQATSTKQTTTVTTQTTTETKTVTPSEITIGLSKSTLKPLENFDVLVTNLPATDKNTVWGIYLSSYKESWGKYPKATITSSNPRATLEAPNVAGQYYVWIVGQTSSGTIVHSAYVSFDVVDAAKTTSSSITVLSPNGGEVWPIGSTQTIRWTSNGFSNGVVYFELIDSRYNASSEDNQTHFTIANAVPNTGSYTWTIPSSSMGAGGVVTPGSQYKIRIGAYKTTSAGLLDYDNLVQGDVSNAPFSITQ